MKSSGTPQLTTNETNVLPNAVDPIFVARVTGDTVDRLQLFVDGTITTGNGTVAPAGTGVDVRKATFPWALYFQVGDETTTITTGTAKLTFRMPFAATVTGVRASVNTVSSSGLPTVDINEEGVSIISTKLSIDANEKSSTTAATPAVISDASIADDAEMTIDIDVAGTGAKGLKVVMFGTRVVT